MKKQPNIANVFNMEINYVHTVLNDSNWHNRIHALEHIKEQDVLFEVALKDYDYRIRSEAIKNNISK